MELAREAAPRKRPTAAGAGPDAKKVRGGGEAEPKVPAATQAKSPAAAPKTAAAEDRGARRRYLQLHSGGSPSGWHATFAGGSRPLWTFDTVSGAWKRVRKRHRDKKFGFRRNENGEDITLSPGAKVAYTKDRPADPPTEETATFAGHGGVVAPRWVQDAGGEWVQVTHDRAQRKFVFTRGDREMVLRKGASIVCTEATPTGAAAHTTYEFPGYSDWEKMPMELAREAAPRKRPPAAGAGPGAKKVRVGVKDTAGAASALTRRQALIAGRILQALFRPQDGKKCKDQMPAEQVGARAAPHRARSTQQQQQPDHWSGPSHVIQYADARAPIAPSPDLPCPRP
jgi:hypothetical protein